MSLMRFLFATSPGKKLLNGATGLLLVGFVIVHLLGNFTFLIGALAFNGYAHFLETLVHGWFLTAAEIALLAIFLGHATAGAIVWLDGRRARTTGYTRGGNAGGPSRKTISSRTMIWTGLALALFIVLHVRMFRFGPTFVSGTGGTGEGAAAARIRDLYGLVVHAFLSPATTWAYVVVMALLGFHLRHGFWSAFQSLGWTNARVIPGLWLLALVVALVLAAGFLFLPLYIHYAVDPALARVALPGGGA
ncbi:MAG: succinate dehydrogenase cytochrome b subunit [Candidatus Krumholzibacteriia bacterium]